MPRDLVRLVSRMLVAQAGASAAIGPWPWPTERPMLPLTRPPASAVATIASQVQSTRGGGRIA